MEKLAGKRAPVITNYRQKGGKQGLRILHCINIISIPYLQTGMRVQASYENHMVYEYSIPFYLDLALSGFSLQFFEKIQNLRFYFFLAHISFTLVFNFAIPKDC